MRTIRYAIAQWFLGHRWISAAILIGITIFLGAGLPNVQLKTIFSDLLPVGHPYAETYRDHPNFGNPLTMTVMIQRKDGDIYNTETLQKVWKFTRDIDLAPGVDHDQVLSIATEKARYAEATPYGIDVRPLMEDHVPQSAEELAQFRERLESSPAVRNFLVSTDGSSTLINATFIESRLDYGEAFDYVQGLVEQGRDEHHDVHLAGQPALTGWVYQYEAQMILIFAVTLSALVLALVIYMQNVAGVLTPLIASAVCAIWGFGFAGWLHSPIEPLLMIVPLLLVARSFSHCVQFAERYYEIYAEVGDRVEAAKITTSVMMAPSILGIVTDAAGIFLIALAPIPAMERFALFCGFWAMMLIPTGVILAPLLLSVLPPPKNIDRIIGKTGQGGVHAGIKHVLRGLAKLTYGRTARVTTAVLVVVGLLALYSSAQVKIGNPVEGSNLLWEDSEFNTAVSSINSNFPGVNTLEIVLEAKDAKNPNRVARQADTVFTMQALQGLIEEGDAPPRATLSFADYLAEGNRLYAGGNPKWLAVDRTPEAVNAAATAIMLGSSAKAFSHVVDFEQQNSTVSLWYKDNKQETVDAALASARKAVDAVGIDHDAFRVRLGTGTIALQQAMNDTVAAYEWRILAFLNLVILVVCSLAYRSVVAGIVLLIPVNLSNMILVATMSAMGVGLDINSLMVAAIGVGVGIDYGIYLLSRVCEEFDAENPDYGGAITSALTTTGKAIMFTATIMLLGIAPWYFLSGLKFLADMGLLLVLTMLINMVIALVVVPLLVWLIKPKFVSRNDLLVGESVDLSKFTSSGHGAAHRREAVGPGASTPSYPSGTESTVDPSPAAG
ncbi:RND transporter [Sinimarinibacterium sp. CAU 1509]|uniref:efflux RND transporter permease subunit n=1 Tax=Sinimarinibacterium sp. CAU 1509 TaxID=2562283 RepID=UPI0010ABC666|nr:efflux RND transporter permease subunit [Sinimarinibacterium sp. CAU 1509]TJY63256.1 RND transporter [Sinimarinibacterium sp. CAU 1509]